MKFYLVFLSFFVLHPLKSQYLDRQINVGIMPSFIIINNTEFKPPRYQASTGYVVAVTPKIGYTFKGKYNAGLIGQKVYAGGTYTNPSSVLGFGYFFKYMPSKIFERKDLFKHFFPFFEWQHIFREGYYVFDEDSSPVKIKKNSSFITLAGGLGIRLKKGFSFNIGSGLKYESFYNNSNIGEKSGSRHDVNLYMYTTFQYDIKTIRDEKN